MDNRSLRYAKLMKTMGIPEEQEPIRPTPKAEPMSPQKREALTGVEVPELAKNRQMLALIDSKIAEIEESDDPVALESINFWKQKRAELTGE